RSRAGNALKDLCRAVARTVDYGHLQCERRAPRAGEAHTSTAFAFSTVLGGCDACRALAAHRYAEVLLANIQRVGHCHRTANIEVQCFGSWIYVIVRRKMPSVIEIRHGESRRHRIHGDFDVRAHALSSAFRLADG